MYKANDEFLTPDDTTPIWRYMNYATFMAMLERQALYFAACSQFQDRFEGSLPKENAAERMRQLTHLMQSEPSGARSLVEVEKEVGDSWYRDREFVAANCWYLDKTNQGESDAMWRLYVGDAPGVAIRSTVESLKKAIMADNHDVFIGEVQYINYETGRFVQRSEFSRFLRKRIAFEHEHELRAMVKIETRAQSNERFDYAQREPLFAGGIDVRIDLQTLIHQIRTSPGAEWLCNLTLDVTQRYGLHVNVTYTQLDNDPIF